MAKQGLLKKGMSALAIVAGVHTMTVGFFAFDVAEFLSFGIPYVREVLYVGVGVSAIVVGVKSFK